jgi:hypothetical protein
MATPYLTVAQTARTGPRPAPPLRRRPQERAMTEKPFGDQILSFAEWRGWEAKWAVWLRSNVLRIGPIICSSVLIHRSAKS